MSFLNPWVLLGIVLAILSVFGAVYGYGAVQYHKGYNKAMAEVAIAKQEADDKARAKQSKIRQKSQEVENEILSDKTGDRPVSPVLARELERLRKH